MILAAYYYNNEFMDQVIGRGMALINGTWKTDFRDGKGKTNSIVGEDKIHDSIYTILSTREGERVFLPEFGSKLYQCIFEQNSLILKDLIVLYTREALANWEKRIVVDDVSVGDVNDDNIVPIIIMYHISNSNVTGSYVYPFNMSNDGEIDIYPMSYEDRVDGELTYYSV